MFLSCSRVDERRCSLGKEARTESEETRYLQRTKKDFCEAMRFLPLFLAKDVARISRQEVTLLYTLYLIPSSLAMFSRKEVLAIGTDDSLEIGYARQPGEAQA
jgi:hypothetical protein